MANQFKVGDRVRSKVAHVEGMKGMEGSVSLAEDGPYYAVAFDEKMKGMGDPHKWLADSELEAAPAKSGEDPSPAVAAPRDGAADTFLLPAYARVTDCSGLWAIESTAARALAARGCGAQG